MARYIDADLIEYEKHEKRGLGIDYGINEKSYHEVAYKEDIDKIPTADVQEVIHGHWIVHEEWFEDEPKPRMVKACSVCKQSIKSNHDALNFCINCGAKMDEETNNERIF